MPVVGTLTTEIEFKVLRGAEAINQIDRMVDTVERLGASNSRIAGALRQAAAGIEGLDDSSTLAAARLTLLADNLDDVQRRLIVTTEEVEKSRQELERLGGLDAAKKAAEQIQVLTDEARKLDSSLEKMSTDEAARALVRLTAIEKEITAYQQLSDALKKTEGDERTRIRTLEETVRLQEKALSQLRALAQSSKPYGPPTPPPPTRLPGGGGGGGGPGPIDGRGLNRTELSSILSMLMSGRVSATMLAQAVFRMGGAFMKALLPVGGLLAPIIAGFGILQSRIGQLTQLVNSARPELRGMVADFQSLGSVDLGGLLIQLDEITNMMKSMGAVDAEGAARNIAQIADTFQFLDVKPGNFEEVARQIEQALRSVSYEPLRGTGIEVDRLQANLESLAEQGFGKAQLRAQMFAQLTEFAMAKAGDAAAQAGREYLTLGGIMASIKENTSRIALEPEMQQAVTDLTSAFASLDAQIKIFSGSMASVLAPVVRAGADLFRGLLAAVNGVITGIADVMDDLAAVADNPLVRFFYDNPLAKALSPIQGFLVDNAKGIREWAASTRSAAVDSTNLMMAVRTMTNEWANAEPIEKATAALGYLAQKGSVTATALQQIQMVAGITAEDMRILTQKNIQFAREQGYAADVVKEMEDALAAFEAGLPGAINGLQGFTDTSKEANDAIRKMQSDIQSGFGIADTITNWANAMTQFNESATPANAWQLARAMEGLMTAAIEGGPEKIAMLRGEFEALFKGGFINQEMFNKLMQVADAAEAILKPWEEQADNLNRKLKDEAPSAAFANNTISNVVTPLETVTEQSVVAQAALDDYYAKIDESKLHPLITPQLFMASTWGGGAGYAGPPGGGPRAGISTAGVGASDDQRLFNSIDRTAKKLDAVALSGQSYLDSLNAIGEKVTTEKAQQDFWDMWRDLGFGATGGGGGGGGGGTDLDTTIEQIRALLRAVNEAIAIGIRGGVRIGTEGNTVPFEPGTFLNAQGGQLTVDTIVIRGVWDFADPATRRQIVKELEQALRELKDEL